MKACSENDQSYASEMSRDLTYLEKHKLSKSYFAHIVL
jgi:hypothetical protein